MELLTLQNAGMHAGFLGRPHAWCAKLALWPKAVTSGPSASLIRRARTTRTACETATRSGRGGLMSGTGLP
jgi:hypothetical protein